MRKTFTILFIIALSVLCVITPLADVDELISNGSTGDTVIKVQIRLRELGYFMFKPTGKFQSMSVDATKRFQQNQPSVDGQPIMSDGTIGYESKKLLSSKTAVRAAIPDSVHIPLGPTIQGTPEHKGEIVSWDEIKQMLVRGTTYTVIDYNTGKEIKMKFTGGENHAEMECLSSEDTNALKEVFGNDFSFMKRPALIIINSKYIAASLQGYPHGTDSVINNDMNGHICLFFSGSLSHVGMLPDVEHETQILRASGN